MGYRDEKEGLKARVTELEGELEAANETIMRLRGEGGDVEVEGGVDPLTGVPRGLHLERELPFGVTDAGLVAIADLLNERIPGGNVAQVGDTLTHRKGTYEMRLERESNDRTRIRAIGDYRHMRKGLLIGTPGLALIGAVITAGLFSVLRMGRAGMAVGAVLGVIAAVYLLRVRLKSSMAAEQTNIAATFEAVADLAARHKQARIAETSDEAAAEAEALAAEEAAEEAAERAEAL